MKKISIFLLSFMMMFSIFGGISVKQVSAEEPEANQDEGIVKVYDENYRLVEKYDNKGILLEKLDENGNMVKVTEEGQEPIEPRYSNYEFGAVNFNSGRDVWIKGGAVFPKPYFVNAQVENRPDGPWGVKVYDDDTSNFRGSVEVENASNWHVFELTYFAASPVRLQLFTRGKDTVKVLRGNVGYNY